MGAYTGFGIRQPANLVFMFQNHVHHESAVIQIHLQSLAAFACLVVELHMLHGIARQIVQQYGIVAFEKVLSVEQYALHLLSVYKNTPIALQLHTGKLFHKRIQHRALCQIEGICIIDERIPLVVEFYLCGCDGRFAQFYGSGYGFPAHYYITDGIARVLFPDLYLEPFRRGLVLGICKPYDIFPRTEVHGNDEMGIGTVPIPKRFSRSNDGAV